MRMVNIENNLASEEMYKHIWLTLLLNPIVTIAVEAPQELQTNEGHNYFMVDDKSQTQHKNQVADISRPASSRQSLSIFMSRQQSMMLSADPDPENREDSVECDSEEEERQREKELKRRKKLAKQEQRRLFWRNVYKKIIRVLKKVTCFRDYRKEFD